MVSTHAAVHIGGSDFFTVFPAASGLADLESYGSMVLANPDFIERIVSGAALNSADHSVYFGVGGDGPSSGYTDFPTLTHVAKGGRADRFQAVVRLKIHSGKLDEFKRIATESISPDARLEHLTNLGENVGAMLEIVDMQAEVWSHSDEQLRASTRGYDVKFFSPFVRFQE